MAKSFKDFVDEYLGTKGTKAKTRKTNPARKVAAKRGAPRKGTAKPNRASQITGKAPTKRLVARRKKNTDQGYFPNPTKITEWKPPYLVQWYVSKKWATVTGFNLQSEAEKYARAFAVHTPHKVRVVKV